MRTSTHALPPHRPGQRPPGHRRAERPGAVGRLGLLRQDGEPRRVARGRGGVALPRAHGLQGDPAARRPGGQPRLRPRRRQAQRADLRGGHLLSRHLPARVPAPGVRRPLRHPPADPPRGRLRDREEGDHRRDPDVPGQPDVGRLRRRQGRALRPAPAGPEHPGHGRVDRGHEGRADARLLRPPLQPGEHRAGLRRQDRLGPGRRAGPGALRRLAGRRGDAPGGRAARDGRVPGDPPRRRPAADGDRRRRRPAARERRPLRRAAPGDHPRRPHRLAALLGPDRPRPRRRRRALVPGLQPGGRVLHLPELRARARPRPTSAGSPRSTGPCWPRA